MGLGNPIAWFRGIRTEVALEKQWGNTPLQYLGSFPGPELGVNDPYLSEYLSAGRTLDRDRPQALREIESLARRGSVLSMLFVADSLRRGSDWKIDLDKSAGWYGHAASLGSGRAMYGLGRVHLARRELDKAIDALEAACDRGCGAAMWTLGLLYKQGGDGVAPDIDKARALFERGASQGHIWSSRTLSILLMSGRYGFWARLFGYGRYLTAFIAAPVAIFSGNTDRIMR